MLHIFGRFFFPNIIKGEYEIPDAHLQLIEFMTAPEDGAGIFPRGFAKTTWEKIDTIHDIVYGLEPVILYISATLEDAQFHFESIKNELESNDWLIKCYGNLVPDPSMPSTKWTNKHFQTTNEINLVARGAGKGRGVNIRNKRPTKIIVDDAESDEQVHSSQRREKYHRWLTEVIMPSRDKERGRIKVIGTVIHPECEVLKFYKAHGGIFRKAIENGESIWPNFWSLDDLIRVRDGYIDSDGKQHEGIGLLAFSQEYLNEPINADAVVFNRQAIERNTYDELPPLTWLEIRMAVDPNAGQSKMADFMGICVIGRDKRDNKRYVLEARKFKGKITSLDTSEETQESVFDTIYNRWNPSLAGIECVRTMGIALYQLLLSKNKYRLTQISPEGKDKVARAQMVTPFIEQDIIKFSPTHVDLYNEMIVFPNGEHDDVCLTSHTLVLTRNGEIKIKDVKQGMEVMTREGWRKVLQAGITGHKQVITNIGITGTWNHPIITTKGVKSLAYVTADDMIYVWNPNTSSIEVRSTTAIQIANEDNCGFITTGTAEIRPHHLPYIGRFGLITMVQYLRDLLFTTSTAIHSIMKSLILNVYQQENTCQIMPINQNGYLSSRKFMPLVLKRQKNGTQVRKESHGIRFMGKKHGQKERHSNAIVLFVGKILKLFGRAQVHVQTHVMERNGEEIIQKKQKKAHENLISSVPVYNLQIEGAHEFFANGILVHNCDAFVYANDMLASSSVKLDKIKRSGITTGLRTKQF